MKIINRKLIKSDLTMSKEISGVKLAEKMVSKLKSAEMTAQFNLKIILVGDDPASLVYVKKKEMLARELGVNFELKKYSVDINQDEIENQIKEWQESNEKVGIIIQLPLPKSLDRDYLISLIKPENDVDGLRYAAGLESDYLPPVVKAIDCVLEETKIIINDQKIAIIGRGFLVGGPIEHYLKSKYKNTNIRSLGKNDPDWAKVINESDILIGAAPVPKIITADMIKPRAVIIDAGSAEEDNAIKGNFASDCYTKASFYTSVPGGIGPLTVAMIFENLIK